MKCLTNKKSAVTGRTVCGFFMHFWKILSRSYRYMFDETDVIFLTKYQFDHAVIL